MAVHVDETLPLHPLSVENVMAMVDAGILDEDDHVELLDGVLVEMSPQGSPHAYAIRRLTTLAFSAVAATGFELSIQGPVDVGSPISLPEPDLAIVPVTGPDEHPRNALLVVEMGATSLRIDLVRKARIYATGNVPEYWVLDVKRGSCTASRSMAVTPMSAPAARTRRSRWPRSISPSRSPPCSEGPALRPAPAQEQRFQIYYTGTQISWHQRRRLHPHGQDHRH